MNNSKRILFIAPLDPFVHGGGAQATLSYMQAVLEIYGREMVDIIIPSEAVVPLEYSDLTYIRVSKKTTLQNIFQVLMGYTSRYTSNIIRYLYQNKDIYSMCIINGGHVAGKATVCIKRLNVKCVVIHHNYEPEYRKDNKSSYTFGGRTTYFISNSERCAYHNADLNLFLTNQDVELFLNAYGKCRGSIDVIGCYEVKHSLLPEKKEEKLYDLAISGQLNTYQTIDGIKDYFDNYENVASSIIPSISVVMTGRTPDQYVVDKSKLSHIEVIPNPVNIFNIVQRAHIFLCPTRIGGGMKLRVMDGLKCGMPILVHEVSARGYDYFFDKAYFRIYRDMETFQSGLSAIISYIETHPNSYEVITKDYIDYFSYSSGYNRMSQILYK